MAVTCSHFAHTTCSNSQLNLLAHSILIKMTVNSSYVPNMISCNILKKKSTVYDKQWQWLAVKLPRQGYMVILSFTYKNKCYLQTYWNTGLAVKFYLIYPTKFGTLLAVILQLRICSHLYTIEPTYKYVICSFIDSKEL